MGLLSVVRRLSVRRLCRNYLWTECTDFFRILVVASSGPYADTFFEFFKKKKKKKKKTIFCPQWLKTQHADVKILLSNFFAWTGSKTQQNFILFLFLECREDGPVPSSLENFNIFAFFETAR